MTESSDPIERMALALEAQNLLRAQELEQARRDETAKLALAEANEHRAQALEEQAEAERTRARLIEELLGEVRAMMGLNQAVLQMMRDGTTTVGMRVDAVLELQRIIVGRMLKDISDQHELDRVTQILRQVATDVRVQTGGMAVEGARDASVVAGQDIVTTTPRKGRKTGG